MLNKNPKNRIGVIDKGELKRHPFFKGLDWQKLYNRELPPPVMLKMDDNEEEGESNEEM